MLAALLLTLLPQAPTLEVGAPHPPMRLPTVQGGALDPRHGEGDALDLRDLLGKKVLVATFASW